jgi:hypothetical protein
VNLFWPPLIILQLLVVWITFVLIKPSESTAEKGTSVSGDADVKARADAASARFEPSERIYGDSLLSNAPPVIESDAKSGGCLNGRPRKSVLGKVNDALHELNDYVTLQQAVQDATSPVLSACDIERMYIESALEEAERQLKLYRELSKDAQFKELYDERYASIGGTLRRRQSRDAKPEERPVQIACADFSFPPTHPDPAIDESIRRKLTMAIDDYSMFLKAVLGRLQRPDLRRMFDEKMRDAHCQDILTRIRCFEAGLEWRYIANIEKGRSALEKPPSYAPSRLDLRFDSPTVQTLIHRVPTHLADRAFAQADPSPRSELRREIEETVIGLKVPLLAHFTRACNLESILEHGLRSIVKAQDAGIKPRVNDVVRLDGRPDAISLSIAFPNHKMFYSYRQKHPDEEWVVLLIDPAILWKKNCGFCQRNASDHRVRTLPLPSLMNASAFRGMFDPVEDLPTRQEQKLMDFDPTDPQAEVLVFETIEPQFIEGVAFDSHEVQAVCAHFVGDRRCAVFDRDTGPFASRGYARKWSS